jgi:hypothetical protein
MGCTSGRFTCHLATSRAHLARFVGGCIVGAGLDFGRRPTFSELQPNRLQFLGPVLAPTTFQMRGDGCRVTMRGVNTVRVVASALVLLALAGCSGGVKASAPQSPVDIGKAIGCDAKQQSPTIFAWEEALWGSPNDATYADIVTFVAVTILLLRASGSFLVKKACQRAWLPVPICAQG